MSESRWVHIVDEVPELEREGDGAGPVMVLALQGFLDAVAAGEARVPLGRTYRLDDIAQAHRDLEADAVGGKGVVVP